MKRYLLFAGDDYYPCGGWDDFKGAFDDVSEAILLVEQQEYPFDWAHIVDSQTGKELYSFASGKWTY